MKIRLPVEPLVAQFPPEVRDDRQVRSGLSQAARILGVSRNCLGKWKSAGGITLDVADELAVRLGMHPCEIWGRDWWDACEREAEQARLATWEDDPTWPWPDEYRVPAHVCALDGCNCGRPERDEAVA